MSAAAPTRRQRLPFRPSVNHDRPRVLTQASRGFLLSRVFVHVGPLMLYVHQSIAKTGPLAGVEASWFRNVSRWGNQNFDQADLGEVLPAALREVEP